MTSFIIPRHIHHGLGSIEKLKELSGKKAIVVTGGSSMKKFGHLGRAIEYLRTAGIQTAVFEGVEPDPSFETVMRGTELFKQEQPDLIIGLGGCSAIDAAKIMWVFYEYPEARPEDIISPFTIKPMRKKATFIAAPSTSGTGTEVTCVAVITDRKKGVKYPIVSYELTPDVAIVDGEICSDMPADVTANTGLDALTHGSEAFVSTAANAYTDALAQPSIKAVFDHLPVVYRAPKELNSRQAMHDASCWAGMAFTNALLGIVHAMAHQLGGMFGVPHGRANAILLPNVIRYNSKATARYDALAALVGETTAEGYARKVEELRRKVGVEDSLAQYGIASHAFAEKLDTITQNGLNDPCVGTNPRKPDFDGMKRIFAACYEGKPVDF